MLEEQVLPMYENQKYDIKMINVRQSMQFIRRAIKEIKLQEALDDYDAGKMTYMIKDGEVIRKASRAEVTKMLIREMENRA